jgi:hypothetical protein
MVENGKHGVYAGHDVPLTDFQHNLILNQRWPAFVNVHVPAETAAEEERLKRAAQRSRKDEAMMDD